VSCLNGMWAVVEYVGCCMWGVEWYVGSCMICGLLYGMWAVVFYVFCCMECWLLNGM